jgi:DNA-binding LacI/PurR family transcriptional regulator
MPLVELGAQATRLLIDLLHGKTVPRALRVTDPAPRLVVRESTAPPSTSS